MLTLPPRVLVPAFTIIVSAPSICVVEVILIVTLPRLEAPPETTENVPAALIEAVELPSIKLPGFIIRLFMAMVAPADE